MKKPVRLFLVVWMWLTLPAYSQIESNVGSLMPFEDETLQLWGFRDKSGKVVIQPRFQIAGEFSSSGLAPVADESGWQYVDTRGRTVVRPFVFDNAPDDFREGFARFQDGELFGFFNEAGQVVVQPHFDFLVPFSEGRAAFCSGCRRIPEGEHSRYTGGKWGFIDRQGVAVIEAQFEEVRDFRGGKAEVKLLGQWITIGSDGIPIGSDR